MKKIENIGKRCGLKSLMEIVKTGDGGWPTVGDYFMFVIIKSITGGYEIINEKRNVFKVKTKDIKIYE